MTISNFNNTYLKLESDNIKYFLAHLSEYTSLTITGNKNCNTTQCDCCNEAVGNIGESLTVFTNNSWGTDISELTDLADTIHKLYIRNTVTNTLINVIISNIPLSLSGLKAQIDAAFLTLGLITNVTVALTGSFALISNIPTNFVVDSLQGTTSLVDLYFSYTDGTHTSNHILLTSDAILLKASFFGETTLTDGIYTVGVKLHKISPDSYTIESNCTFIDMTYKCKVASVLKKLLDESATKTGEKFSTTIHLLHYSLINGSNCGCNCGELCEVYEELNKLLLDIDPQITNDCGC